MEKVQYGLTSKIRAIWKRLSNRSYRHAFLSAKIDSDLSAQIYSLREQRSLTQGELGELAGMAQPRIAKLESTCDGVTVNTLKRLASACDVALVVKFVSFSEFLQGDDGPIDRHVPRFDHDKLSEARSTRVIVMHTSSPVIEKLIASSIAERPNFFSAPLGPASSKEITIQ